MLRGVIFACLAAILISSALASTSTAPTDEDYIEPLFQDEMDDSYVTFLEMSVNRAMSGKFAPTAVTAIEGSGGLSAEDQDYIDTLSVMGSAPMPVRPLANSIVSSHVNAGFVHKMRHRQRPHMQPAAYTPQAHFASAPSSNHVRYPVVTDKKTLEDLIPAIRAERRRWKEENEI